MAEFKTGDTVRLKSGSPVMTVRLAHSEKKELYSCAYFHEGKFYGTDSVIWFDGSLLESVERDSMSGWVIVADQVK
jgi:uncharacterized protein YodC (DUF2158 family)